MVAIDVVHYMKSKNRANSSDVALKLVYSKNYDRTYWDYLCEIISKVTWSMGFVGYSAC
jgi:hypothetical protein